MFKLTLLDHHTLEKRYTSITLNMHYVISAGPMLQYSHGCSHQGVIYPLSQHIFNGSSCVPKDKEGTSHTTSFLDFSSSLSVKRRKLNRDQFVLLVFFLSEAIKQFSIF